MYDRYHSAPRQTSCSCYLICGVFLFVSQLSTTCSAFILTVVGCSVGDIGGSDREADSSSDSSGTIPYYDSNDASSSEGIVPRSHHYDDQHFKLLWHLINYFPLLSNIEAVPPTGKYSCPLFPVVSILNCTLDQPPNFAL